MDAVTLRSTRFGELEVPAEAVIEFPNGLIGLGGSRYTLLARSDEAMFVWLHSVDDPAIAIPLTNPWKFFADYAVELSDERRRSGSASTDPAARAGLRDRPRRRGDRGLHRQPPRARSSSCDGPRATR